MKGILTLLIGAALFYFVVIEAGLDVVFSAVSLFFDWRGIAIVVITFLIMIVAALRWREVIRFTGEDISLMTILNYHIKGFTVDYLTPFAFLGGEAVRVFLIKKEVGIKKGAFSSITDKIIGITTHFLFMTGGVILFVFYGATQHSTLLFYATAAIVIIFLLLLLFYVQAARKKSFLSLVFKFSGGFKRFLQNTENGKMMVDVEREIIRFFSCSKRVLAKGFLLSIILNILFLIRVFLVVYFITGSTNIIATFIIYGLVVLSMILPLPAAIGGMDAILGIGFSILGMGLSAGVMAAIVLRSADLAVCFVGILSFIKMSVSSFWSEFNAFIRK